MLGGGAILVLLLWRLGSGPFVAALHVVSGRTLVAALLIGVMTTVLSAWRWVLVARGLGMRLSLGGAVSDYYRSLFLNSVLPGGVLGDVHRAVRHGRDIGDVGLAVKAVVLERTAGQIVLLGTGATILLACVLPGHLPELARPGSPLAQVLTAAGAVTVAGVLTVAAAVGGLIAARALARRRRRSRAVRAARAWAGDARRGLFTRGNRVEILIASAAVLAGNLAMFVVAARTAGSTAPIERLAPLLLLALMAMALPLNVGGWGPREAVMTWAFAAVGLNAGQGLTMAVVYGVFALVASLPGAAVLVGQRVLARRRELVGRRAGDEPRVVVEPRVAIESRVAVGPRVAVESRVAIEPRVAVRQRVAVAPARPAPEFACGPS